MRLSTTSRKILIRALAVVFWLGVWQIASMIIGQEILLVSPVRAAKTLIDLMGTGAFWQSVFSSFGRILLGFALAATLGAVLAALAGLSRAVRVLLEPLMHTVKATPVASFVILALIFIRSTNLSVFISFLMVLPIMYTNVLAGIDAAEDACDMFSQVEFPVDEFFPGRNESCVDPAQSCNRCKAGYQTT